ncbi:hypothetical protein SALWKB12_0709 [Snodgrassella communis]|nr:hypothetical protein SALWKB12_0709 [Snodgrassella communis]
MKLKYILRQLAKEYKVFNQTVYKKTIYIDANQYLPDIM